MDRESPFAVLGIQPTLEAEVVRRAYFMAVARCPPHGDPIAFRRVRGAYERLSSPAGRAAACVEDPPGRRSRAEALRARFDAALEAARREQRARSEASEAAARFVEWMSSMGWSELRRTVWGDGSSGGALPAAE